MTLKPSVHKGEPAWEKYGFKGRDENILTD